MENSIFPAKLHSPQAQPIEAGQQTPKLETSGNRSAFTEQATRTRFRGIRNILSNLFLNGMPQFLKNLRTRRVETQANDKTRHQNFKDQFMVPKGLFFGAGKGKTVRDANPLPHQPVNVEVADKPAEETKPASTKQTQVTLKQARQKLEKIRQVFADAGTKTLNSSDYDQSLANVEGCINELTRNSTRHLSQDDNNNLHFYFKFMLGEVNIPPAQRKEMLEDFPLIRTAITVKQGRQILGTIRERYDTTMATHRLRGYYEADAQKSEHLLAKFGENGQAEFSDKERANLRASLNNMIYLAESDNGFDANEAARRTLLKDWPI